MALVIPTVQKTATLDAMTDTTAQYDGLVAKLWVNEIDPDGETDATQFDSAAFAGYAPISVITWTAPALDAEGVPFVLSQLLQWVATSATGAEMVRGVYLVDGSGDLAMSAKFETPVAISADGDSVSAAVKLTVG